jgi:hypothetical protein
MAEDAQLEVAQFGSRLQPKALYECVSTAPVGSEGIGLATAAIEGEHELCEESLTSWVIRHKRLELRDERRPLSVFELGRDPLLDRRDAEPIELPRIGRKPRNVAQRITAPESERLHELPLFEELAEVKRVDRDVCDERIAGVGEVDRIGAEKPAQARHIGLHDLRRAARRRVLPQQFLDRRNADRQARGRGAPLCGARWKDGTSIRLTFVNTTSRPGSR